MAKTPTPHPDGFCDCGAARVLHIGDKPCTVGAVARALTVFDLPVAEWAWREDATTAERR